MLCQTSAHSEPLRKYIATNYDAIRTSPARVIVRESENSSPVAIATFSYGVEKTVDLRRLNAKEIDEALSGLEAYSQQLSRTISL